jgi:hypothetical protein
VEGVGEPGRNAAVCSDAPAGGGLRRRAGNGRGHIVEGLRCREVFLSKQVSSKVYLGFAS